ncbi:hypothetical protein IIA28_02850 [candidate division KSB1 bacterium]|nr:hypothetical protein [candidate division KSB1 bacterium]
MKFHRFEIYDYNDLERFMQPDEQQYLAFAGRNTVRLGEGRARETFYLISVWMASTAAWHTFRLFQVTV